MNLIDAYNYLNNSSYRDIRLTEAADECIKFAIETANRKVSENRESAGAQSLPEGNSESEGNVLASIELSDDEKAQVIDAYYQEKRIKLLQKFCAAFVSKARELTDDIVRQNRKVRHEKDKEASREITFKAHQVLSATKGLALFMGDVDLTCINGLYLACTGLQKRFRGLASAAAKKYNDGKTYSEEIGTKADIKTRKYSLLEMFMYPSGQKPNRK